MALFGCCTLTYHLGMNEYRPNDRKRLTNVGNTLRELGAFAIGLVIALFAAIRNLVALIETPEDDGRRLHDSDLTGELNHRTGRLDAGTDPHGWYDD